MLSVVVPVATKNRQEPKHTTYQIPAKLKNLFTGDPAISNSARSHLKTDMIPAVAEESGNSPERITSILPFNVFVLPKG